jgi:hypothetical protein
MQQIELFLIFTGPFDSARLRYMVTGSIASMVYGEPRLTNDIDIVLELDHRQASDLIRLFPLSEFYCPPQEVIVIESRRLHRGHFNLIHQGTGHKADVYLCGRDPLHEWGMSQRRRIEVATDETLWIAPPEYVILRKLESYREGGSPKHRDDIEGMLAVSGDMIDKDFLKRWIQRLGVQEEWATIAGDFDLG